jgi:hypothetical protein
MAGRRGARVSRLDAYRAGFMLRVGWVAIAVVLVILTRETHSRQVVR